MSTSMSKVLELKSSDGEIFEAEEAVAVQSEMIKNMVEDGCTGGPIPLVNVNGVTLAKVIEWCKKHTDQTVKADDLKKWDAQFVYRDQAELYDLIMAANYLNIKDLLELICQKVADMIKGKAPEEVRKIFKIDNDFTPDEEERIRRENAWAFE